MLLEKSAVCGQRLADKREKYLFTVTDLQQTYSQWYQMVGLVFCKHTSSRTKKARLIDHGSWSYKLSKAVPAQHYWLMVPSREAVEKGSWVLREASGFTGNTQKKGKWSNSDCGSGDTEKIIFNFPRL